MSTNEENRVDKKNNKKRLIIIGICIMVVMIVIGIVITFAILSSDSDEESYTTKKKKNTINQSENIIEYEDNSINANNINGTSTDVSKKNDTNSVSQFVDRQSFVNNLTEDNKTYIKDRLAEEHSEWKKDDFIEDKFITIKDEIVYVYTYVNWGGEMNAELRAEIFTITPMNTEIPSSLNNVDDALGRYFIIKNTHDCVSLSKGSGLTDDEISAAKSKLNTDVDADIEKLKNKEVSNNELKSIVAQYRGYKTKYHTYIPTGYNGIGGTDVIKKILNQEDRSRTDQWDSSGYYIDPGCYYQVIDGTKIIQVSFQKKLVEAASYSENGHLDYIAMGVCIDVDNLPLMYKEFSIQELISAGYLKDDSNSIVVSPVKSADNTNEAELSTLKELNQYIRSSFSI